MLYMILVMMHVSPLLCDDFSSFGGDSGYQNEIFETARVLFELIREW
jgi:hypothetical protein